jgi:hypothetical protein
MKRIEIYDVVLLQLEMPPLRSAKFLNNCTPDELSATTFDIDVGSWTALLHSLNTSYASLVFRFKYFSLNSAARFSIVLLR